MSQPNLQDLKQLAILAELARPLAHECNNFLNNLLLQLAISEKTLPESSRGEWANIRREAKKLASLLQQFQRQRKQTTEGPTKIELGQLIRATAEDVGSKSVSIQVVAPASGDGIYLKGFAGEVQRLVSLLMRYGIAALQSGGVENPALEIQVGKSRERIHLRLRNGVPEDATPLWGDFDDLATSERTTLSLPALTCKSLVERLDGTMRIERDKDGRSALAVDLPLADS